MMDEHGGKVFIQESAIGRLYMYWAEWRSNRFLHIRYWYLDKKDNTWKPGMKGVAIPEPLLEQILAGFKQLLTVRS